MILSQTMLRLIRLLIKRMHNRSSGIFFCCAALSVSFVLLTNFAMILRYERSNPGSTMYGFPFPYLMDYLQYISIIRSGQEGSIFFINQYSELNHPPMFLQAHYSLLGFITGLFDINPFFAFTLARYIALIALTVATVMLAFRIFKPFYAVVATMFFLTSTGFYYVTGSSIFSNNDFETYSH